jgi:N-acetylglucosamine malate deacetylase 2
VIAPPHPRPTFAPLLRLVPNGGLAPPAGPVRLLLIAAHPDDETLSAGVLLARLRRWGGPLRVLHLTDGAPRDRRFWHAELTGGPEAYARARREELRRALALAGVAADRLDGLGLVDQEAAYHLPELARRLAARCAELRPELVLTHAYEGGHPDHDAAAFAVHAAARLLARAGREPPPVAEMAGYHAAADGMVVGRFLPGAPDGEVRTLVPTRDERALKSAMLECFATQRSMLAELDIPDEERFRPAPRYDFSRPPHPGPLQYELWDFPLTGHAFRELARRALAELGLRSVRARISAR